MIWQILELDAMDAAKDDDNNETMPEAIWKDWN